MFRLLRWLSFLSLLTLLVPMNASAQSEHDAEGRAAFEAGSAAYSTGDFASALSHFQRAYELSERAELLFNIGQCHDRLRQEQEAITALESYLAQVPDADNRDTVSARIEILRERIAEEEAREREVAAAEERALRAERERNIALTTTSASEPQDESSVFGEWWFWTIVGVVVVGATVAIVAATTYDAGVTDPVLGDGGRVVTALEW